MSPLIFSKFSQKSNFHPNDALTIIKKWGPCTRTIMEILQKGLDDSEYIEHVEKSATNLANDPTVFISEFNLTSIASHILYLVPVRRINGKPNFSRARLDIPTATLAELFSRARKTMSNNRSLQLFTTLSSHSLTRAGAGWNFEMRMHTRMFGSGSPLSLIPDGKIYPSQDLLQGTVDVLSFIEDRHDFYWFPSVSNFEGIDAVYGDKEKKNIYALQATVAPNHKSPMEGLKKVWSKLPSNARNRKWTFVVVCDDRSSAQGYLDQLERDDLTFKGIKVAGRVCVLER